LGSEPSNLRIVGVALLLFSSILLGVGIHHLVATGTCSSTGYSANYGPVPHCPSGTGWWFAFVFGGIIGSLAGALMAGSLGLVFAGIFGAIGFGSLSILLDPTAKSGEKLFAGIFGGCFAIVGVVAWIAVISSALGSLRRPKPATASTAPRSRFSKAPQPQPASTFGTPEASSAFGTDSKDADPILSAYNASHAATPPASAPSPTMSTSQAVSPLNLVPGLQAAKHAASQDAVDELSKLADLHQKGALTDEEFASAKAKLLGQM
jgi:Short C-terminal domain